MSEDERVDVEWQMSDSGEHDSTDESQDADGAEGSDSEFSTSSEEFDADLTDTSDEEEVRNTRGNVPLEWYDELSHFGYDIEGRKIAKPVSADRGELEDFLAKMDDPNYWKTVKDSITGKEVVLTDEQIDMIQKLQQSCYPEESVDPYEPYVDHFTAEKQLLPLSLVPKPKSSFIPSKWEHRKIVKLVHAIRMGWLKPHPQVLHKPPFYKLWEDGSVEESKRRHHMHIAAPRMQLPGHAESYNPPPEYLPTQKEKEEWLAADEEDRSTNYLPQRFASLREVPAYSSFIKERFERCLDLYLCPRQRKMRVQVNPDDLIPELPRLSDLQPFPTVESLIYEGHSGVVQCVSVEASGQWLASASSDCSVKLWEVCSGRCMCTLSFPSKPVAVAFCPNTNHSLLGIAVEEHIFLVNSMVGDSLTVKRTAAFLEELPFNVGEADSTQHVVWGLERNKARVDISHSKSVRQFCWHSKGDYLAVVTVAVSDSCVHIHQLSRARSQVPIKKLKGEVQSVLFHPHKPLLFIATQTCVRVYHLIRLELVKRLLSGVRWISSMALHPSGDHLLLSSYDKKLCWFDLELSSKPYKVLRQHKKAVRSVCFHSTFPLFASGSDDGSVIVCHGKTFNDLLQNPLIVPVKVFQRSSRVVDGLGTMDVTFHPVQPWLFTAGADSKIRLYCN